MGYQWGTISTVLEIRQYLARGDRWAALNLYRNRPLTPWDELLTERELALLERLDENPPKSAAELARIRAAADRAAAAVGTQDGPEPRRDIFQAVPRPPAPERHAAPAQPSLFDMAA